MGYLTAAWAGLAKAASAGGAVEAGTGAVASKAASASLLTKAATATALASTAAGAYKSYEMGKAEDEAAKVARRQGRLNAIRAHEELMKTISANNVAAATSGLESAGSVQYAQDASKIKANREMRIAKESAATQAKSHKQKAKAYKQQSVFDVVGGTITAGEKMRSSLKTKKKTTG